jgi:hypothetical protein
MADKRVQDRLTRFQRVFPEIDLSQPQFSSHGRYLYNLHLVFVHDGRWVDVDETRLEVTRSMFTKTAAKKVTAYRDSGSLRTICMPHWAVATLSRLKKLRWLTSTISRLHMA